MTVKLFRRYFRLAMYLLAGTGLGLSSCQDKIVEVIELMPAYNVYIFLPYAGLGDGGYTDQIMLGATRFNVGHENDGNYNYVYLTPKDQASAAEMLDNYMLDIAKEQDHNLYVLTSSDYSILLDSHLEQLVENNRANMSQRTILLLDSDGIQSMSVTPGSLLSEHLYTSQICTYGASYQAGISAHTMSPERVPLIWLAYDSHNLDSFVQGFTEGYRIASGGKTPDMQYLASDASGFVMADSTYRAMSQLSTVYDFIFPVMGGSNMGIYRYQRENADAPYAVGMDIDQSIYSNKVVGSVTKNIAEILYDEMEAWLQGSLHEHEQTFGFSSAASEWIISEKYKTTLSPICNTSFNDAAFAEEQYLK